MILPRRNANLLLYTALTFLGAVATSAAQTNDHVQLETIVVKGKRIAPASAASDTPLATQTSAEEIRKNDIDSLSELGRSEEVGVEYDKARGGLFIRGLGGARVTTLIDGIPILYVENSARSGGPTGNTNADGGTDSFDFASLSKIDVVRGADSSKLGSGSLGGGLVLKTLEPRDVIEEGRDWGGIAKSGYDGSDRSWSNSISAAKAVDNTSVLFQGGFKRGNEITNQGDVDDIGPTRTKANAADLYQSNLLFKVRQHFEGGHTVGITAERFDSRKNTELKTTVGATSGSSRSYEDLIGVDDMLRERISLDYLYEAQGDDDIVKSGQATIYWQRLKKSAGNRGTRINTGSTSIGGVVIPSSPWLRSNDVESSSFGVSSSAEMGFGTGELDHSITIGADISVTSTKQFTLGIDACTLGMLTTIYCDYLHSNQADMPDVGSVKLGMYVEDSISIDGSALTLTPGLRFDWFDYQPKNSAGFQNNSGYSTFGLPGNMKGNQFSPKILATYDLANNIQVFGQWSMAYRAPTIDELYLNFSNPAQGYAVIGNDDLDAEIANGFEIGASFGDDDAGGRIAAFRNFYRNFIDSNEYNDASTGLDTTKYFNRDRVIISGFELNLHKRFENGIRIHGSLAYAYGKDTDQDLFLRSVAPVKAAVGIGYDTENWGADVTTVVSGGMREDAPVCSTGFGGTTCHNTFDAPGYGFTDVTAWWEPQQAKGLRLQAGIYNVFDKTYWNGVALRDQNATTAPSNSNTHQSMAFFSEPGRTFKISLTQKF